MSYFNRNPHASNVMTEFFGTLLYMKDDSSSTDVYLRATDSISATQQTAHSSVTHLWFAPCLDAER